MPWFCGSLRAVSEVQHIDREHWTPCGVQRSGAQRVPACALQVRLSGLGAPPEGGRGRESSGALGFVGCGVGLEARPVGFLEHTFCSAVRERRTGEAVHGSWQKLACASTRQKREGKCIGSIKEKKLDVQSPQCSAIGYSGCYWVRRNSAYWTEAWLRWNDLTKAFFSC